MMIRLMRGVSFQDISTKALLERTLASSVGHGNGRNAAMSGWTTELETTALETTELQTTDPVQGSRFRC
jgi:hypothetical protein